MEFYLQWPESQLQWAQWISALVTIAFGMMLLFAPRMSFRILRLQTRPEHPEAVSEARGTMAGFYIGLGACCILFEQPLIWLTLGICWAVTAFGRLISMMSDRGNTFYNWTALLVEIGLASLPILAAYGFFGIE